MSDGFEDRYGRGLSFPFAEGPAFGEAIDIAPGVKWLRQPLSMNLRFINVWAIDDGGGWAIVDTGMGTKDTIETWRTAFAGALGQRPATRVFATHMHPDHCGLAAWLMQEYDCRLWMTRLEYLTCRSLVADTGREAPPAGVDFYRAAGWDEAALDGYRARFGYFGRTIYAMPDAYRRLIDGEVIRIGAHDWQVVVGSGHSPEHACLYCPELKLLISGDQVLPKISSNVSVFPTEPEADPLKDWLRSLASIKARVPDDVLVLPAHNDPFRGLHARLEHLIGGHERGLERLRALIAEPKRAVDVFGALFHAPIGGGKLGLATGEAISHLNCLIGRGQAVRTCDAAGVAWYQAA